MSLSMYQASVPVYIRMLTNLIAIMEKAASHCEAGKIDPSVLIDYRLYPDMFSFAKQVRSPPTPPRTARPTWPGWRRQNSGTPRGASRN